MVSPSPRRVLGGRRGVSVRVDSTRDDMVSGAQGRATWPWSAPWLALRWPAVTSCSRTLGMPGPTGRTTDARGRTRSDLDLANLDRTAFLREAEALELWDALGRASYITSIEIVMVSRSQRRLPMSVHPTVTSARGSKW